MEDGSLMYRFGREIRAARLSVSSPLSSQPSTTTTICVMCCEPMTDFVARLVFVLQRLNNNITVQLIRFCLFVLQICVRVLPGQLFVSAAVKSELHPNVKAELQRHSNNSNSNSHVLVVVDRRQHDWVVFAQEQQPPPAGVVVVLDDNATSMTLHFPIGGEWVSIVVVHSSHLNLNLKGECVDCGM